MMGTYYDNAEVDRLLEQARRTVDDKARLDLYLQAEKIALDEVSVIPLYSYRAYRITNNRIANFAYTPMGAVDMWTLWVK
jgi:ABC-type transport system substrate-binding protein